MDGMPIEDGWLMRYNPRRCAWEPYMPVDEWQARTAAVDEINAAAPEDRPAVAKRCQREIVALSHNRPKKP